MRKTLPMCLALMLAGSACSLQAEGEGRRQGLIATPESAFGWAAAPGLPGVQTAWLQGNPEQEALYILRVKFEPGARVPPHRHPDVRYVTVLSGELRVGVGEAFSEGALRSFGPGAYYVVAAGVPHFLAAGAQGAVYQETGVGPTAQLPAVD